MFSIPRTVASIAGVIACLTAYACCALDLVDCSGVELGWLEVGFSVSVCLLGLGKVAMGGGPLQEGVSDRIGHPSLAIRFGGSLADSSSLLPSGNAVPVTASITHPLSFRKSKPSRIFPQPTALRNRCRVLLFLSPVLGLVRLWAIPPMRRVLLTKCPGNGGQSSLQRFWLRLP